MIFQKRQHEDDVPDLKPGISRRSPESEALNNLEATNNIEETIKIEAEDETSTSQEQRLSVSKLSSEEVTKTENIIIPSLFDKDPSEARPIDFTEKIGIEDKIDLYKAVFLSSSESEDETEDRHVENNSEDNKIEEFKAVILSESLIPRIKPMKEGILSGINFKDFNESRSKLQIEAIQENTEVESTKINPPRDPLLYGPHVPVYIGANTVAQNMAHKRVDSSDSEDEWVEKDAMEKKEKSRHKKKDKKHKHKKHKRKYKR